MQRINESKSSQSLGPTQEHQVNHDEINNLNSPITNKEIQRAEKTFQLKIA